MKRDPQSPKATLQSLIERFGGASTGDTSLTVDGVAPLERASPNSVSFFTGTRYRAALAATHAGVVLMSAKDAEALAAPPASVIWTHQNPYAQFARVAQFFAPVEPSIAPGIHASAVIGDGASIASTASIGPFTEIGAGAVIGEDVVIGANCSVGRNAELGAATRLYARVTIAHGCVLGERCIVHSGVVIGADGFGFAPDGDGFVKIPQTGKVVIGNDVEIGANTTIDRGAMDDTVIGDGVKLDNQIQIGHNVRIGEGTVIAGCAGIAGSAVIGAHCMLGGAVMIVGHLTICDRAVVSGGTLVSHSIRQPGTYTGFYPMADNAAWEKNAPIVRHLDKLRQRIRALENYIKNKQGTT
jgi:UDP-3-O-[3-hydroxymyristoyl] glucosamine N-acyltransferase